MRYVDGYVLPVPKKNLRAYRRLAKNAGRIWREHGALEYREWVGDDLKVKFGLPFPRLVKAKPDETVVFAWIVFKSRAHRDRVNAKVMKDPRLANMGNEKSMPIKSGQFRGGGQLRSTSSATTVRMTNGKTVFTDGPFAETKEQLGGYHLVDCKDLDEALAIAARIPTLPVGGAIEVRPFASTHENNFSTSG